MDLVYHFVAGVLIALAIALVSGKFWELRDKVVLTIFFFTLLAGLFKEVVIDFWINERTIDHADIAATWFGGIMFIMTIAFIKLFKDDRCFQKQTAQMDFYRLTKKS